MNLIRSLTARLKNSYCSITVANYQLITLVFVWAHWGLQFLDPSKSKSSNNSKIFIRTSPNSSYRERIIGGLLEML